MKITIDVRSFVFTMAHAMAIELDEIEELVGFSMNGLVNSCSSSVDRAELLGHIVEAAREYAIALASVQLADHGLVLGAACTTPA